MDMDEKKQSKDQVVPLEEALKATGFGKYTILLFLAGGFVHFCADCGVQIMSFIVPAASCDLKLSSYEKGLLTSMGHTGMVSSAHLCGVLSDVYGRRKVLLWSLVLQAALCIVSSLAPNGLTLMVCWFLYGNTAAGVLTPVLVYINEFCEKSSQTKAMIVMIGCGALAEVYLAIVAWLVIPLDISIELIGGILFNSWRLFLALLSVPTIISMLLLLKFPESPKFVLNQGKKEETLQVLREMYARNNNDIEENYPISNIELDLEDMLVRGDAESGRSFITFLRTMLSKTALLFNKTFIFYTLLSSSVLFGIGAAYMTLLLWIPDQASHVLRYAESHNNTASLCEIVLNYLKPTEALTGKTSCGLNDGLYLLIIALGLAQVVSCIVTTLVTDKMNKKLLLGIVLITPGLLSILAIYVKENYLIIGCLIFASTISAGSYPVTLSFVMRYFPTSIRSNATSITMNFGRVGISCLNFIFGILVGTDCGAAYWIVGSTFIGSALLCFFLPSKRKLRSQ